ncbi:MAG: hypothetical protein ACR2O3_16490 [Rhizobiaceae bacterium]
MEKKPLHVENFANKRDLQHIEEMGLTSSELLGILASFDQYGVWRLDLAAGQVYWSRDTFLIHGMEPHDGPVDFHAALTAYHPEDSQTLATLIDETIANKSGFRFVLRLRSGDCRYKLVKSIGTYRIREDGAEEIVGTFSKFAMAMRSIAVADAA